MSIDSFQDQVLVLLRSMFIGCPHLSRPEFSYIFGGNLVRSALAYKIANLLKINDTEKLLPYMTLIELVHSVSLLQDDIIDGAKTRRGSAVVHSTYSTQGTLFLTMYILTKGIWNFIANYPNENDFLQFFSESIQEVCLGEISQNFSSKNSISESFSITQKKTGELFSLTFHICSFVKKYSPNFCYISKEIGLLYGFIFQIKDDLQDFLEDQSNKDIYKSFPILLLENIQKKEKSIQSKISQTSLLQKKIKQIINKERKKITQKIKLLDNEREKNDIYLLLSLVNEITLSLNSTKGYNMLF